MAVYCLPARGTFVLSLTDFVLFVENKLLYCSWMVSFPVCILIVFVLSSIVSTNPGDTKFNLHPKHKNAFYNTKTTKKL